MRERVLVEIPERGHGDHRGLIGEHFVHDALNGALHLPHVDGSPHSQVPQRVARRLHRAHIGPARSLHGVLVEIRVRDVLFVPDLDSFHGRVVQPLDKAPEGIVRVGRAKQLYQERRPFGALDATFHDHLADPVSLQRRGDGAKGREVAKIHAQPDLVHEEEVADHAKLHESLLGEDLGRGFL